MFKLCVLRKISGGQVAFLILICFAQSINTRLRAAAFFYAKESVSLRLAATAYVLSEHKPCFPTELEAMTYAIFVVICQYGKENPYNCCGFKKFS